MKAVLVTFIVGLVTDIMPMEFSRSLLSAFLQTVHEMLK
jgi:hypothetical protein